MDGLRERRLVGVDGAEEVIDDEEEEMNGSFTKEGGGEGVEVRIGDGGGYARIQSVRGVVGGEGEDEAPGTRGKEELLKSGWVKMRGVADICELL